MSTPAICSTPICYNINSYQSCTSSKDEKIYENKPIWKNKTSNELFLNQILYELKKLQIECKNEDWDGEGAKPLSIDAYFEAKKFLNLIPSFIPFPEICIEPNGDVGFEWRKDRNRIFIINIGNTKIIKYAGIFGGNQIHGNEYFENALPPVIIENFKRLGF